MTISGKLNLLCIATILTPTVINAQQIITTVVGNGQTTFAPDGVPGTSTGLKSPTGVAVDGGGRVYFSDTGNHQVRRLEPNGTVTTIAGTGQPGFSGDGGPATKAMLNNPAKLFVDRAGNLFISDVQNVRIRRVTPSGVISTIAGNGQSTGPVGDGGPATAAVIHNVSAIAGDSKGNIYFGDVLYGNTNGSLTYSDAGVRKIAPDGTISRYAGAPLSSSQPIDGVPNVSSATFLKIIPSGIAFDSADTLYVSSPGTGRFWKIGPNGFLSGSLPFFTFPDPLAAIAVDFSGFVYFTQPLENKIIIEFTVTGNTIAFVTYAGTDPAGGVPSPAGFTGDNGDSTKALLNSPFDIAVDPVGRIYIADTINNRIRAVTRPPFTQASYIVNAGSFSPGPIASGELVSIYGFNFTAILNPGASAPYPATLGGASVNIKDSAGQVMPAGIQAAAPGQLNILIPEGLASGTATLIVTDQFARSSTAVPVQIGNFAPGLFTANANGKGVAAATALLVDRTGNQTPALVFQCATTGCVSVPLDLGDADSQLVITLYGTGIRGASQSTVTGTAGGQPVQVVYSGAQGTFPGLDQVNIVIPPSLKGAGEVDLILRYGTQQTNAVKLNLK